MEKNQNQVKAITVTSLLVALATVLSFVKLSSLPFGGSTTLLSMFFIIIIGYYINPKIGIIGAFVYGILQFIIEPYMVSIIQVIVDYGFAFTALGLGALVFRKRNRFSLEIVIIISMLGRLACSIFSGVVFFGAYAPEGQGAFMYSLLYNSSYIIPEMIITLIFVNIPGIKPTLEKLFKKI